MTTMRSERSSPRLTELTDVIRDRVRAGVDQAHTADLVKEALRPFLDVPGLLTEEQRRGDPERYLQHVLHVEPDASFSVVALVWLPGQQTPVHDHVAWCVTGVYQGAESEQHYRLCESDRGPYLVPGELVTNHAGETCGFAPPGDIHRVRNCGTGTAISLHVYGADIGELGTSVRRVYDLPVHE
ncbi:Predicted metal-dependent enzyme of the double-stranded beta helix superfamily [Actinopolyspora alba]|uniref:Predicted metal-dependent enzyme of the double-stranded beta helix superfamily n=1 Tax=Actinopolyspora alba TaxID=673379 RepID=A0A1I1VXM8_9ACTN|nr:cysteine dioxygenase family protein [Actinopolyspora alba]SFD87661.1 Predicted metal-dependent enzyme of the double-stranded beta helix superfamily [Actinopolyspora alba]